MKTLRLSALALGLLVCASTRPSFADGAPGPYRGTPYHDSVYKGGPQPIPGRVQCAYYDLGGEGVAFHNTDARNKGSGMLNPANGSYLNEFRMNEAVGISYTKFHDAIDDNPFDLVKPAEGQLYVGWTNPGEWFNLTVEVARAGVYEVDLLYTSNRGGKISLDLDGKALLPPNEVLSTREPGRDGPVAAMAPLEPDEGVRRGQPSGGRERAHAPHRHRG